MSPRRSRTGEAQHPLKLEDGIRAALRDGPGGAVHHLSSPRQLAALTEKLRPALRSPWLLHLWIADPHRLLRALGIELVGRAREGFDARLRNQGVEASPDEYERILTTREPVSPNLFLPAVELEGPPTVRGMEPLDAVIARRLDQMAAAQVPSARRPRPSPSQPAPLPPSSGLPASHSSPARYDGTTGDWDVVLQIHEHFFRRLYDGLFALHGLGGYVDDALNRDQFIDFRFTFESWLFVFIRVDLVFDFANCHFRMRDSEDDAAGIEMPFTATTFSRLLPEDEWDRGDEFSGSVTRWGRIVQRASTNVFGAPLSRVYVADLAGGWNEITIDGGPDPGRTEVAEPALSAYFAAELPEIPLTMPVQKVEDFNVSWANSAAFSRWQAPDLSAVTLCFDPAPEARSPFHEYILHHGRNLALGIDAALLKKAVLEQLPDLPLKEGIATIDRFDLLLRSGVIELLASGFIQVVFKVPIQFTAEITLRMVNGELTAELSESSLQLPAYLWFLAGLFGGLPGLAVLAIAKALGKAQIDDLAEDRLDVREALSDLLGSELAGTSVSIELDSVGIGAPGVFLRGNATPYA